MLNAENLLNRKLSNPPIELWDESELIEKLNMIKANPTAKYDTVLNPSSLTDGATYNKVQLYDGHNLSVKNLTAYIDHLINVNENDESSYGDVTLGNQAWLAINVTDTRFSSRFTIDLGSTAYLISESIFDTGMLSIRGTCYLSSNFRVLRINGSFGLSEGSNLYIADAGKLTFDFVGSYNNYGNIYCNKLIADNIDSIPEKLLFSGFGRTYIGYFESPSVEIPETTTAQVTINWLDGILYVPTAVKDKVKVIRTMPASEVIYT